METHYYTATSIDGRIADEEDSLGWLFQFSYDPGETDDRYEAFVADVGAIVMGSTIYEWLLREEIRDDPCGGAPLLPRRLVTPPLVLEECRLPGPARRRRVP